MNTRNLDRVLAPMGKQQTIDFSITFSGTVNQLRATCDSDSGQATERLDAQALQALGAPTFEIYFDEDQLQSSEPIQDNPSTPIAFGRLLFELVFVNQLENLFRHQLGRVEGDTQTVLRILLRFDPRQPDSAWLQQLPWELLYESDRGYLATSRKFSIVRCLDVSRPALPLRSRERLKCLAVGASPRDATRLDVQGEVARLRKAMHENGTIELEELLECQENLLHERLLTSEVDILHFIGHGWADADGKFGLLLNDRYGNSTRIESRQWAERIVDASAGIGPRLIVLNACRSAESSIDPIQPFRGVAQALVASGVPAVLAMNRPISDIAGVEFASAFYRGLSKHGIVDTALIAARRALRGRQATRAEWFTPALFLRGTDGRIVTPITVETREAPPTQRRGHKGHVRIGELSGDRSRIAGVSSTRPSDVGHEGSLDFDKVTGDDHTIDGVRD